MNLKKGLGKPLKSEAICPRISSDERQRSTRTHQLTIDVLAEMMGKKIENREEYLQYLAIRVWSDAHGIVSIYNSRVLFETVENAKEILDRRINEVIDETIASCIRPTAFPDKTQ